MASLAQEAPSPRTPSHEATVGRSYEASPEVQEDDLRGQRRYESVQVMKYGPAILSVVFLYRVGLTISCITAVRLSMLTGPCCDGAFLATWWVVGLCVYLVFTFAFRTTSFSSAVLNWNFDPTEPFAMLYAPNHVHKFNACVLLVGAVWSVFGVICAFLLPPQDDFRNLFRAIINYAISTFVIYPAELYVLHWILIPLREDLNDLINPRSPGRLSKRGNPLCSV